MTAQRPMGQARRWLWAAGALACAALAPCDGAAAPTTELHDGLRVVRLAGTPYELGWQHGSALRDEIRDAVRAILGHFRRYLHVPLMRTVAANWWLGSAWRRARPFTAGAYLEELRGLADGAGVPLVELHRLHAIPERTYSCANLAAWGRATVDGRLVHVRNLDWTIEAGIQRYAAVFVVRPQGKHAFVSLGWAGFIGVLTGINEAQLSIGQIGAETTDVTFRGEPMAFLMRRVLEQAVTADDAAALIAGARRTVGVNYVLADAKARRALAVETTAHQARVFEADDALEHQVPYARPMRDAVFRADAAIDPAIRDRQLASRGDPSRPGLESPGGSAYDVRYLGQAAGLAALYGQLDGASAQRIAQAVAPGSNVQSVVFAWPDIWVANAQGRTPAASTRYHRLDATQLFAQ